MKTRFVPLLLIAFGACGGQGGEYDCVWQDESIDLADYLCDWVEHPDNPLIEPAEGDWLIGDPTVLKPDESVNGLWNMWAYGFLGIHHLTSSDGIVWEMKPGAMFGLGVVRPFVYADTAGDDTVYYLFVEKYEGMTTSAMYYATSFDLENWTDLQVLLAPELDWEMEPNPVLGNPYLTFCEDQGLYRMYYSAGNVYIPECDFYEPRHIGVATASDIAGPWTKRSEPIVSPSESDPLMNMGAGSIKLLDEKIGSRFVALNNGIYQDAEGYSRSAIEVLSSVDGIVWEDVCGGPVVAPGEGWKNAFVYAFDTVRDGDTIRMYFNARDDWADGVERIGMAVLELPCLK